MEQHSSHKRTLDLALQAGRKRQSPRTRFVHFCKTDPNASDTIPLFENFCFALALFRQKTVESVVEAKELLDRLLAFQVENGNFPIYLHDYPKCYDPWMGIAIAPLLLQTYRHFAAILSPEQKTKLVIAIEKSIASTATRSLPLIWEHRLIKLQEAYKNLFAKECRLQKNETSRTSEIETFRPNTREEWFDWVISEQLTSAQIDHQIPYHPTLQTLLPGSEVQEKGEPRPSPLEWILAEKEGFSQRFLEDHPSTILTGALFPIHQAQTLAPTLFNWEENPTRLLWKGCKIHSLCAPKGNRKKSNQIEFCLDQIGEPDKGDLIEAAFFCDLSPETEIFIDGKKGTVFYLGQTVTIHTPCLRIHLYFELTEGSGEFCGQISRSNRPSQTACKGPLLYEAYDWRIGLRTLRRQTHCTIIAKIELEY